MFLIFFKWLIKFVSYLIFRRSSVYLRMEFRYFLILICDKWSIDEGINIRLI